MPREKNSIIQGTLITAINHVIRLQKIGSALPKLLCTFGNLSLVLDVVIFSWQRIPVDDNGDIANIFNS